MGALDGVLLAVLLMSCLLGLWRGVIRETMALAAWLLGFLLSSKYAADMAVQLPPDWGDNLRYLAGWLLVFVAVWLGMSVLSALVQRLVAVVGLGLLDRFMGGVFGVMRGGIALMAVSVLVGLTPAKTSPAWMSSWVAQSADEGVKFFKPILPAQLERLVS
jgi:membrane protein required for colicin V production